jgi:uncharacterized membrane protein YphA (DoxX/SURF4 family)
LVQRLFTMFPSGLPGLALMLLRSSVALALLFECYAHRQGLPVWLHGVAIVLSVALALGILTPIAAMAAVVVHALIWSFPGAGSALVAATVALDAIALAFLGPGAYSIDAQRYGRRIVVLTPP